MGVINEKKDCSSAKTVIIFLVGGIVFAALMGFLCRPLVAAAAPAPVATVSDATPTDPTVDISPYLTNKSDPISFMDLLLSIRNILVCIWGTIIFIWSYSRLKAIICRLGGVKKNE